jgi:hypothetical protein
MNEGGMTNGCEMRVGMDGLEVLLCEYNQRSFTRCALRPFKCSVG